MFAELTHRSSMKRTKTRLLLRFEPNICWTAYINKFIKSSCAMYAISFSTEPSTYCDTWKTASKTQHKYLTGAYQLSENIFDSLADIKTYVPQELKMFSHLFVFDFEPMTVPDETLNMFESNH